MRVVSFRSYVVVEERECVRKDKTDAQPFSSPLFSLSSLVPSEHKVHTYIIILSFFSGLVVVQG